jgi:hypothetical protein
MNFAFFFIAYPQPVAIFGPECNHVRVNPRKLVRNSPAKNAIKKRGLTTSENAITVELALGRFTTTDPEQASASLFEPQSWNLYSYVWNCPVAYKDPNGRNPLLVTAAVGADVGAPVGGGFELVSQFEPERRLTR